MVKIAELSGELIPIERELISISKGSRIFVASDNRVIKVPHRMNINIGDAMIGEGCEFSILDYTQGVMRAVQQADVLLPDGSSVEELQVEHAPKVCFIQDHNSQIEDTCNHRTGPFPLYDTDLADYALVDSRYVFFDWDSYLLELFKHHVLSSDQWSTTMVCKTRASLVQLLEQISDDKRDWQSLVVEGSGGG